MLYRSILIVLFTAIFFDSSHAASTAWMHERAHPIPILTMPFHTYHQSCSVADFQKPCAIGDQGCRERKGACGEALMATFEEDLFSINNGFSRMTVHEGHYAGNQGLDSSRTIYKDDRRFYAIGEAKAGAAKLSRQSNQMSGEWVAKTTAKIASSGRMSAEAYAESQEDLRNNNLLRSVSHVSLAGPYTSSSPFLMTYSTILPKEPKAREAQLRTYCETVHAPVMDKSRLYASSQSSKQRLALSALDSQCRYLASNSNVAPVTRSVSPSHFSVRPGTEIETKSDYNRENLHGFLDYLNKSISLSHRAIATKTTLSDSTIGNIIRNKNHAPTANYESLWNDLKRNFSGQFTTWWVSIRR